MWKQIDRDVVAGLDQLLNTPSSRRRAVNEIADCGKNVLSSVELMMAMKHGDITPEEYEWHKKSRDSSGVQSMLV